MNITVDIGNSSIKVGIFREGKLKELYTGLDLEAAARSVHAEEYERLIVSSVSGDVKRFRSDFGDQALYLDSDTALPVLNKYQSPETLGMDRIAAAVGGYFRYEGQNVLVIDLGTAINYEFVDSKANYWGGAISPGVSMRYKALHNFTAGLPLVDNTDETDLVGRTTRESIHSGVMNGVAAELTTIIGRYSNMFGEVNVILCGGDAHLFESRLKAPIFVAPQLVLEGLNRILEHNEAL